MHKLLLVSMLVVLLCIVFVVVLSFIIFRIAICSKGKKYDLRKEVSSTKHSISGEVYSWFYEMQDVNVVSSDNLLLTGYKIISVSNKWVIVVHGYGGFAGNMIVYIDWFYKHNYNVLVINLRGHGTSQGNYYGLGLLDGEDLATWATYIINNYSESQITLFGISMGAAACLTSAANYPNLYSSVISDSAPSNFVEMFLRIINHKLGKLGCLIIPALSMLTKLFAGYCLYDAAAERYIEKITCPVLYIHGACDGFVPAKMMQTLYDKTRAYKVRLLIDKAEHTQGVFADPDKYWSNIANFLGQEGGRRLQ